VGKDLGRAEFDEMIKTVTDFVKSHRQDRYGQIHNCDDQAKLLIAVLRATRFGLNTEFESVMQSTQQGLYDDALRLLKSVEANYHGGSGVK
jgi:hypothetical protein